jgi:hypothetical protein
MSLIAYSDGSKGPDSHAGAGWALFFKDKFILKGNKRLENAEVPDAEALGALEALKAVSSLILEKLPLSLPPCSTPSQVIICLDNL